MDKTAILQFRQSVLDELNHNIIPFWLNHSIDRTNGGFIGRMTNDLKVDPNAPKGVILNARILWTFSTLYRHFKNPEFLKFADRAYAYISRFFYDPENGGYFWLLDLQGKPVDDKKKVYGQGFVIYALSEYYMASGKEEALQKAKDLFNLIESNCRDREYEGYFETYNRDWTLAGDSRLSDLDMDEKKSMNNHLHILEGYTNLYRIWKSDTLKSALVTLIDVFLKHIIHSDLSSFILFFDESWNPKSDAISYGHNIEGSWLLYDAVEVLGEKSIIEFFKKQILAMAETVLKNGVDDDGGLFYDGNPDRVVDTDKHWWPQAESTVGCLNAFQLSGDEKFLAQAMNGWYFIKDKIVDKKYGEWFWKVSMDGRPDLTQYKISEWKGPYHNVRACLETIRRIDIIIAHYWESSHGK